MSVKLTRAERTQEFIKNITPIVTDAASEYWLLNTLKLCSQNPNFTMEYSTSFIIRHPMLTMDVLTKYKHIFESLTGVEKNPNLTVKFIKENLTLHNWNWFLISKNKNMTPQIIEQNNDLPWCYQGLSSNPNLTPEFIRKYRYKNWDWDELMHNDCITFDMIINNSDLPWQYNSIAVKTPPIEYITNNPHIQVNWRAMTVNQPISAIINNPKLPWDYTLLACRKDLPIEFVISNLHILNTNERMRKISYNAKCQDIIEHPEIPWNMDAISCNKNLTEEFIINNFDKFNIYQLSINGVLTVKIIRTYKDKFDEYKCWELITKNNSITQHNIESNSDLPWIKPYNNPNVSNTFILKYTENKKNIYKVSESFTYRLSHNTIFDNNLVELMHNVIDSGSNPNNYSTFLQKFTEPEYRKYLAAYKIQQWWFKVTTDYKYAACRKKVARDYDDMLAI